MSKKKTTLAEVTDLYSMMGTCDDEPAGAATDGTVAPGVHGVVAFKGSKKLGYYDDDGCDEDDESDEPEDLAIVYEGAPFTSSYKQVPYKTLRPATEAEMIRWLAARQAERVKNGAS